MASTLPSHPSAASLVARDMSQKQLIGAIKRAANLINIAKKPVIYAGQGMIALPEGPKLLKELADKACIPVTTTVQGLGGFDELDEKSLHMLGMHGSPYANMAIQDADLVVSTRHRLTPPPHNQNSILSPFINKPTSLIPSDRPRRKIR